MADDKIGLIEPGTANKYLDAASLVGVGGQTVFRERTQIAGLSLAQIAAVLNTAPAGSDYGLVTRLAGTADVSDRAARLLGVVYGSAGVQLQQASLNANSLLVALTIGGTSYDSRLIRALTSADVVSVVDSAGGSITVGQKAMAASVPVVIASDQSTVPVSAATLPLPTNAAQETDGNLAVLASLISSQEPGWAASLRRVMESVLIELQAANAAQQNLEVR